MNDFNDFPIYKQQGYDINQRGDIPYFLITIVFSVSIFALEWYLNPLSTVHDTIISLPFAFYGTFVVEQKHGFNKTTVALFFRDKALTLLLTSVIGSPIISIIILLVRWGGQYFYFYVWLFLAIVSILLMTIFPVYIAPLFNKYTRLESGPIYQAIEGLAEKVKFPLTEIYVVDGSKRSAHSNAYFYGFFKNKRIVLYDTLISQVSQPELLAILGHEIGHWKLWHTATVQQSPQLFASFGFACGLNVPVFIGLMLFAQTFWSPVEKLLSLIMNFYSRSNEFAADEYSAKLENLGNLVPDSLYSLYHFSHPPLVERLRALQIQSKKFE
eukprot:gene21089-27328_t